MTSFELDSILNRLEAIEARLDKLEKCEKTTQTGRKNIWPHKGDNYWHMESTGAVWSNIWYDDEIDRKRMAIGNVFRTEGEAGQAIEELKALKRLRDKGFKFEGWNDCENPDGLDEIEKDLTTIFGGRE